MELPVLDETVSAAVGVLAMELCRGVFCLLLLVLLPSLLYLPEDLSLVRL